MLDFTFFALTQKGAFTRRYSSTGLACTLNNTVASRTVGVLVVLMGTNLVSFFVDRVVVLCLRIEVDSTIGVSHCDVISPINLIRMVMET